jgi:hypothetical protein
MCSEAKLLFDEYCAALSRAVPSGGTDSARRLRIARTRLSDHSLHHGCCTRVRFEWSPPECRWKVHSISTGN